MKNIWCSQSSFCHHGVIIHSKQRGFSEIYPLLWCLGQAVRIRFHSEHMGSLTCVRTEFSICVSSRYICVCLYLYECVCLTVSWEGRTSSSSAENIAETSLYVAEFTQVNSRVWNACFPHWAEHFLMQYVSTCVTTQRAEILRGHWAMGYRTGLCWRGRDWCASVLWIYRSLWKYNLDVTTLAPNEFI